MSRAFAFVSVILVGCAAPTSGKWQQRLYEDNRTPRIILQVCVPDSNSGELVSLTTVRRDSLAGGHISKDGTTLGGQPYFEDYSGFVAETKAIVVSYSQEGLRYVFLPPKKLSPTEWTQWLPATYASDQRDVAFRILYGQDLNSVPVPVSSPRLRIILMPFVTYLDRVRDRRTGSFSEAVPQC
jgi:hypothetical protein